MYIYSNGVVNGLNNNNGSVTIYSGGYLLNINNCCKQLEISSGGIVSIGHIDCWDEIGEYDVPGNIIIYGGGLLTDVYFNCGEVDRQGITILPKGIIANCTFDGYTGITISSGGSAINCTFNNEDVPSINITYSILSNCTFNIMDTSKTVNVGTNTQLINATISSGTMIKGATIRLGGTSTTFYSGGISTIRSAYTDENHRICNLILPAGAIHLVSGIHVNDAVVGNGYLYVYPTVVVSNAVISATSDNRRINNVCERNII